MDLCLQGSGDLSMCGSQTDRNTARILVFWDDFLMFLGILCEFDVCLVLQGRARLLVHALV